MCFSFHLKPNSNSFCAVIGFPGLTLFTIATNLNKTCLKSDSEGNYWHFNWSHLVCLRVLKDKRSATLLVALHDYLSPDPRVKRLSDKEVPREESFARIQWREWRVSFDSAIINSLVCLWILLQFFFFPKLKSILLGWHVCEQACMCVRVCGYIYECPCVLALLVSLGAKTTLLLKYKHSSSAEPRGELHRCRCFSRCQGPGESISVCRHACTACVCMLMRTCAGRSCPACVHICIIQLYHNKLAWICFLHAVRVCECVCAEVVKPQVFCHSLSGCTDVTHPQAVTTGHSAQLRPDSPPLISRTTSSAYCTTTQGGISVKTRGVLSSEIYPEALPFHRRTHTPKHSHKHTYACTRAPQLNYGNNSK